MSLSIFAIALMQIPGLESPELTWTEWLAQIWKDGGWMMWPLGFVAAVGVIVIIYKLFDLGIKGARTSKFLQQIDALLTDRKVDEALAFARENDLPAARILAAGLARKDEGTERVSKAIESVGLVEMAGLERGLIWIATAANVGPLLGFLGTVMGMIAAFQAIENAGEVDAQLVAGGIKIALITTAAGLVIAIPMNIFYNYFVTKIDGMVIDMEESAQKMIEALHDMESTRSMG